MSGTDQIHAAKEPAPARARVIAFYLPQYHPIPENDEWWGSGFTEWHNVRRARPLYPGHYQPHEPTELGYYDLRDPGVREAQAEMARRHGVEAFCYWHYWFGNGRRLLERPFNEVLRTGKPDFPFCLGWANDTWTGIWYGAPGRVLMEQQYPGIEDYRRHFFSVLEALHDKRYLRVEGKPLFLIYRPHSIPDIAAFLDCWRELAAQAGLPGLYLVAHLKGCRADAADYEGFDAFTCEPFSSIGSLVDLRTLLRSFADSAAALDRSAVSRSFRLMPCALRIYLQRRWCKGSRARPLVLEYDKLLPILLEEVSKNEDYHPFIISNWDNTPRCGARGVVYSGATPSLLRSHLRHAVAFLGSRPSERRLIFLKSWNEWAEGNYLEPEKRYGRQFLEAIKAEVEGPDV